jgi:hypothetical protein
MTRFLPGKKFGSVVLGKDGKFKRVHRYPSVSAKIAAKKSKRVRVIKGLWK